MTNLKPWLVLALFVILSFGAAGLGGLFTASSVGSWYAALRKPVWTPPSGVFGPVWSVLYLLMGVSAWLVWYRHGLRDAALPLALFVVQLILNAAWSGLFFGLQRPDLAFAEIVLLWGAILATTIAFGRATPGAGWLMLPYLLWVTFAAGLNFAIWRLNA